MDQRARITIAADDKTAAGVASVRQRFASLQGDIDGLAGRLSGLAASAGALVGAFGLGAFVKSVTDGLDRLNDLADATGASVENLSGLEAVALRTGTSFDAVSASLLKLNQALNNADNPEIAATLAAIGLSAADLKALDPAQALLQTAQAFEQFAADGNRARAEQTLFGRSLREIAPFLKDLADAGGINATVTREQADAAEAFSHALAQTQLTAMSAGRTIVSEIVPALTETLHGFQSAGQAASDFSGAAALVRTVVETLSVVGAYVADTFRGVGREIGAIAAQLVALARLDIRGFRAISKALAEDNKRAEAELQDFVARVMSAGQKVRDAGAGRGYISPQLPQAPSLQVPDSAKHKQAISDLERYSAQLRDAMLKTRELSAVEQARIDIARGMLGKLSEAEAQHVLGMAASLDALRALQAEQKAAAKLAEEGAQFTARFATEQEKLAELVRESDRLVQAGAISWQTWGRAATKGLTDAMAEVEKTFAALPKLLPVPAQQIDEFARQASRNIQDALGSSILESMKGSTSNILSIWRDMLMRMAAEAAGAKLAKLLLGDYGKTGELGGWIGSLFGGGTDAAAVPKLASGMSFVPRDNFPALLHRGERVLTADENRRGVAGGNPITYAPTINLQGSVSAAQVEGMLIRERSRFARMLANV